MNLDQKLEKKKLSETENPGWCENNTSISNIPSALAISFDPLGGIATILLQFINIVPESTFFRVLVGKSGKIAANINRCQKLPDLVPIGRVYGIVKRMSRLQIYQL